MRIGAKFRQPLVNPVMLRPHADPQQLAFMKLKEAISQRLSITDWQKLREYFSLSPISLQSEAAIWEALRERGSFSPAEVQPMRVVLDALRVEQSLLDAIDEYGRKYCKPQASVKRYDKINMHSSYESHSGGFVVLKGQVLRFLREYAIEIITQPGKQAATLRLNPDHYLLLFSSKPEDGLVEACQRTNACVSALWLDACSFYVVISEAFLDDCAPEEEAARSEALNAFAAVGNLRADYQILPAASVLVAGVPAQRIPLIVAAFRCQQCNPEHLDAWENLLEILLQRQNWQLRPFLQLFVRSVITDQEAVRKRDTETLISSLESISVQLIGTPQAPAKISPRRIAAITATDDTATIRNISDEEILIAGPRGLSQRMLERRPALEERLRCTVSILAYCTSCKRRVPYTVDSTGTGSQLRGPCGHWCAHNVPSFGGCDYSK